MTEQDTHLENLIFLLGICINAAESGNAAPALERTNSEAEASEVSFDENSKDDNEPS